MKKILLPLVAILFSLSVFGQDYFVGPKLGLAGTSFFTNAPENIKPYIGGGFDVGGFFRVHNRYFFFQPELEYRFGSGKLYSNSVNSTQTISYSLISVPLQLGLKIPLDKKNTEFFRAYGGGSVGALITGVNQKSPNVQTPNNNVGDYFSGHMEPFAWSWLIGAGIDLGSFMIDLKYDMIWNNIATIGTNQNTQLRANTLILAFSYRFKLDLGTAHAGHNTKKSK